jgi:hypothetical protein
MSNAQEYTEYIESDDTRMIITDFDKDIPMDNTSFFSNFEQNPAFGERIEELQEKSYFTTNADRSTISINLDNIGMVVIYATLFNESDSSLYNPLSKRNGTITIIPYRDGKRLDQEPSITKFDEFITHQIQYKIRIAGVNKIDIIFDSQNDLFILEKLKIVPLNRKGIQHYKESESRKKEIFDLANNLKDSVSVLKDNYKDHIGKIEIYHKNLSKLISGNVYETVSTTKANSLNPFRNGEFLKHYKSVLENADAEERSKIEAASKKLGGSNFADIAMTLGNLYTGGSFSSMINLIGGVFDKSIALSKNEPPLLKINSQYYHQKEVGERLKLTPVDETSLNKIEKLKKENDAFKNYVSMIIKFTQEDLEKMIELEEKIHLAKIYRNDLEELTWAIVKDFTKKPKRELINDSDVQFSVIGAELEAHFKTDSMDMSSLNTVRSESIISISKFRELSDKYSDLTSKIKTDYDDLYENQPDNRTEAFDHLAPELPFDLINEWKNGQKKILNEYRKDDGLKQFLEKATGEE